MTVADGDVFDVLGIGFGPSNLALAIAVHEHADRRRALRPLFLERQATFGWHRGMLIDDATMQVSFLKDLVTLRNPKSEFSFLSYLHSRGRLVDFINHKTLYPLRSEFHDYLEWSAAQVADQVRYGSEVVAVRGVPEAEAVVAFEVTARQPDGRNVRYLARNLVLGMGLVPRVPTGVEVSDRIWHNHDLLSRVATLEGEDVGRLVVVGAGQSAAEVTAYLHERFPRAEVCAVFSRFGYSPADDSPFANRVFDPSSVDEFFTAPEDVKRMILDYHGNTNYSVVDLDLIEQLYRTAYRESVAERRRLRCFNVSRVVDVVDGGGAVSVTVESLCSGQKTVLAADAIVFCTGYHPADPAVLLGDLVQHCRRDRMGRLAVTRDYRLHTTADVRGGIYLQGGTEHTHGLTSSLLSNSAVRAAEILRSVESGLQAGSWRVMSQP